MLTLVSLPLLCQQTAITLIDGKRATNCAIAIARIRFSYPEIRERIGRLDQEAFSLEQLNSLRSVLYTIIITMYLSLGLMFGSISIAIARIRFRYFAISASTRRPFHSYSSTHLGWSVRHITNAHYVIYLSLGLVLRIISIAIARIRFSYPEIRERIGRLDQEAFSLEQLNSLRSVGQLGTELTLSV
jgi:hypothetical protein